MRNHPSETLPQRLARFGYSLLILGLVCPVTILRLLIAGVTDQDSARRLIQRLGRLPANSPKDGYLFHCVSVGEVVAASVVIKALMQREPDVPVTISTTTATGADRVRAIFGDTVTHCYLPYDIPGVISAWLTRLSPRAIFITEVELWPNLLRAARKQARPVMVINARMTDRSARQYAKIRALFTPMLHNLTHVCAQGERDYQNYLRLGITPDKLTLTQNIKFDQVAAGASDTDETFMGLEQGAKPVIVGGSTHEPEEALLLDACASLNAAGHEVMLILVPRHPQRFDDVAGLLDKRALRYVRTSQASSVPDDCQVILVDEMGKLNAAYRVATVAFVGGSVAPRGGHNALEPAAVGVPVVMGPSIHNNPVICAILIERGALVLISDAASLTAQCQTWLDEPDRADKAGKAGRQVLTENQGALAKTLECISHVLAEQKTNP
ncbi:3-deoxy-D-manno-octulosonic acid transferase [Alteromonas sp. CYL-A6]|uniref:3-deoxy-D-manno-octulosonic acid transferase n=1 Tax=Alteromonas nitratireducens TaxID=3390813 RepID=UPI0034B807A0